MICSATERIVAARAELAITRSNLFPQVQGNGNFIGGQENTAQSKYNLLTLTADAAFQLDLFGRLRRATEASRAQLLATEAARQTVVLTLVSDVAADYFTLLQLDLQLQITRDTVTPPGAHLWPTSAPAALYGLPVSLCAPSHPTPAICRPGRKQNRQKTPQNQCPLSSLESIT